MFCHWIYQYNIQNLVGSKGQSYFTWSLSIMSDDDVQHVLYWFCFIRSYGTVAFKMCLNSIKWPGHFGG